MTSVKVVDDHYIDKIQGMFAAIFVGDALGGIFERRPVPEYTNVIDQPIKMVSRYYHKISSSIGQITDDSEMTLMILNRLIKDKKYKKEKILMDYLEWANLKGPKFTGINTRNLFGNVKTERGYNSRYKKHVTDNKEPSQSNGALMRCSPFFLIPGNSFMEDVKMTNPHPINIECEYIYILILRLLFLGESIDLIFNKIKALKNSTIVKKMISDVEKKKILDVGEKKGWVIHALYIALFTLKWKIPNETNIMKIFDYIIGKNIKGDTDTNGVIAGAFIGIHFGLKTMLKDPIFKKNLNVILTSDTSKGDYKRSDKYHPKNFMKQSVDFWVMFRDNYLSKCILNKK